MWFPFGINKLSSTDSVDIIEKMVYELLKPLGFRKHGRTLHRFVDGDISQVVNFQNGCSSKGIYNVLWVNLGIRVPECAERKFVASQSLNEYYHEYECNMRARLGSLADGKDTSYSLKKNPESIGKDIILKVQKYVLPIFGVLNSRNAILDFRKDCAEFDEPNNHLVLLEEAMIYGRRGDIKKAAEVFNRYYQENLTKYEHELKYGVENYLRKGEHIEYYSTKTKQMESVIAAKSGYVTLYSADRSHLTYLEGLAKELNISLLHSENAQ